MNFVYVSPHFPKTGWKFCDRLHNNGVTVLGIGDCPYEELDGMLKNALTDYYRVNTMENYDEMLRAVAYFTFKYGKIDWLESNNEHWLEQDAALRDDFNITTGWGYEKMRIIKQKSEMKAFYEKAKVPVASHHIVSTYEEALKYVKKVGYPLVVKPNRGVGAHGTYKILNAEELTMFYNDVVRGDFACEGEYIMEEFITGNIQTYDAIIDSNGEPIFETSYTCPPVMDTVNDGLDLEYHIESEVPAPLRDMGRRVVKAFEVKSRFVHFEFFKLSEAKKGFGKVGDFVALEVNMRHSGGYSTEMYNYANSVDVYKIWADMIAFDRTDVDLNGKHYYCSYASRFDNKSYKHSHESVVERYRDSLVMCERMPEVFAATMGDRMYMAKLDTAEQVDEFRAFVHEH